MSIQDGTTEFIPKSKFKFSHKGQMIDCDYIVLKEPKAEHARHYMKLRQMIKKSEMDLAVWAQGLVDKIDQSDAGEAIQPFHVDNSESTEENTEDTKKQVESLQTAIEQSDRVELFDFIETFSKMVCAKSDSAIAICNGQERFKATNWERMNPDDQLEMASHWCSFFVTPSGRGQTTTEPQSDFALKAVAE